MLVDSAHSADFGLIRIDIYPLPVIRGEDGSILPLLCLQPFPPSDLTRQGPRAL
jgi:hypothetical protein